MTIATTVSTVTIQGNGATTLFNYDFLIPAATDAVVTVTDTTVNPVTTTTISSSLYAITGIANPDGGAVQYPLVGSPLAAGQYITIQRVLPLIQTTQISNQGNFYPEVVEAAFDYQMMCIQQLSAQIAAASFPDTFVGITGQPPITISQSGGQYVVSLQPITASSISNSAVTTSKLADGAATLAKLDRTGTSGYVLTAQGAGSAPIWAPPSAITSGTFTPALRFGGASVGLTYSAQDGGYTVIGNVVWVRVRLVLTAKGSSTGSATITGLPFTIANRVPLSIFWVNMTGLGGAAGCLASGGTTTLALYQSNVSTGYAAATDAVFTNTSDIAIEGIYQVS